MKNFKISSILDFLLGNTFVFLVCLLWTRLFAKNVWLAVLASAVLTFVISGIFYFFKSKKTNREKATKKDRQNAYQITTHFLLCTKAEVLNVFFEKFDKKYKTEKKREYLIVNDRILMPIYSTMCLLDRDILDCFAKVKNCNCQKVIVTCKTASDQALELASQIEQKKFVILQEQDAYQNIFKPLDFDVPNAKLKESKKRLSDYLAIALNKSRAKGYFLICIISLFCSFILKYNIYYLVFSTISVMLALYSYFNTKFNKAPKATF